MLLRKRIIKNMNLETLSFKGLQQLFSDSRTSPIKRALKRDCSYIPLSSLFLLFFFCHLGKTLFAFFNHK